MFDELERLGYDCELRRSGVLTIARTPAELAMCRAEYAAPTCSLWRRPPALHPAGADDGPVTGRLLAAATSVWRPTDILSNTWTVRPQHSWSQRWQAETSSPHCTGDLARAAFAIARDSTGLSHASALRSELGGHIDAAAATRPQP